MISARRAALRLARDVPSYIDREDIVGAAYLGLAEALKRLGPEEGPTFEGYALQRARGAVLDFLRSYDLLTRGERATARRVADVTRRLIGVLGREPLQEEIEDAVGGPKKVNAPRAVDPCLVSLLVDEVACNDAVAPDVLLEARRVAVSLRGAMELLSPRLREVLEQLYFHEARLREVGAVMGVSESRACQLHRLAISELKVCPSLRKCLGLPMLEEGPLEQADDRVTPLRQNESKS